MANIHPIQISILKQLMYSPGLRYSQMKPKGMEGSQFTFHLDQLLTQNLIIKEGNLYTLTESGKSVAGKLDLSDSGVEEQAKISVLLVGTRTFNGIDEYLLYTRKKTPFYDFQGFPTGKVKKGEDILVAAKRELLEETGLQGIPTLIGIRHYKIHNEDSSALLEDKIYFIVRFTEITGELISGPEGEYKWVEKENVWSYLTKPVPEIKELFEHLNDTSISFAEGAYTTSEF